ncbi:MAG TPA: CoA transferase, partial [Acidimicrobiia bacterium]|nr:CoA transferase [Acidimicrobiia bacterium]
MKVTLDGDIAAWADSGLAFLTGRADGPALGPPPGFVTRLLAIAEGLSAGYPRPRQPLRSVAARPPGPDPGPLALLAERAAIAGLRRRGAVSCGGAARLMRAGDGWLCVNLPRPDDLDLLPAWLPHAHWPAAAVPGAAAGAGGPGEDVWSVIAEAIVGGDPDALAERAQLLGLAVAPLPRRAPVPAGAAAAGPSVAERRRSTGNGDVLDGPDHTDPTGRPAGSGGAGPFDGLPVTVRSTGEAAGPDPRHDLEGVVVADLSSLWAGPVCSRILQQAGARVIKVESIPRPDGARRGPAAFFDRLHAGQESVALDFAGAGGRAILRRLLGAVDVVIEGSRPRALEQLGISALELLGISGRRPPGAPGPGPARTGPEGGPTVWVSITGYGREGAGRDKVAFGDDAAAAGGLVAWDADGPCFLADAIADPCTGLVAAAATLSALSAGGRWLVDVALRDVAA